MPPLLHRRPAGLVLLGHPGDGDADFVVVASPRYRATGDGNGPNTESRGVQSEAALLGELVYTNRAAWLPKVLHVLLSGRTPDHVPLFLQLSRSWARPLTPV